MNTNQDLIDRFEHDLQIRDLTKMTIYNYIVCLKEFAKIVDKDFMKVTKADLRDYLEVLRRRGISNRTASFYLGKISGFYDFLVFEDHIATNPVKAVQKRYLSTYKNDGYTHTHKIITIEQASKLINSIIDIRDKTILLLLLKTGIRRGELISIDLEDIDWTTQKILLKSTKKRSNRIVFFDDETATILHSWLKTRSWRDYKSTALFVGYERKGRISRATVDLAIRKAALRVGLHDLGSEQMEDHFSAHCTRHFFTTCLLRSGMPREYVKELRGDVRKEAIDLYHHISEEELRESYLAHIPQLGI